MKKYILLFTLATFAAGGAMAQTLTDSTEVKKEKVKKEKKKSKFCSFVKKVGETTTGINMTDEPFIINPNSADFDAEFAGAYGNSSTGKVSIVFKVKNKTYAAQASFGGSTSGNGRTVAFDVKGKNYYQYNSGSKGYAVAKGIWTEVMLDGKDAFENVPSELQAFELIKMSFYFDAKVRGMLEFRNIPIQWDVAPAE
jgi:hypothetical protein